MSGHEKPNVPKPDEKLETAHKLHALIKQEKDASTRQMFEKAFLDAVRDMEVEEVFVKDPDLLRAYLEIRSRTGL